jgi:transcriptional/translational regulatory protein YebC/TACO1
VEVFTKAEELQKIKEAFEAKEIPFETAQLSWVPKSLTQLDQKATMANMRLIDALEELEDVAQVYSNLEISDEAMAAYEAAD